MTQFNTLFGDKLVKSISFSEHEILSDIHRLYLPDGIHMDPCYNVGKFYSGLPKPKYKFDLEPIIKGVVKADAGNLPLENNSIKSIMFDPPFICLKGNRKKELIIEKRFSGIETIEGLWDMYSRSMKEFARVLVKGGAMIVKCQDVVYIDHKNYFSHIHIFNTAMVLGFEPLDLFILLAKNRIMGHGKQEHARKFHCYFWVFKKK